MYKSDKYGTKSVRVGEEKLNTQGLSMKLIEYHNALDVTIEFEDGLLIKKRQYSQFVRGNILNFNYPHVESVGYIGYGKYTRESNLHSTQTWYSMLTRCYGSRYLRTYKDCTVHPDWHNFQNFAKWYEENYIENYHLDKDILVPGNKVYGPDTCCFVPVIINCQFRESRKTKYGKGIVKRGNVFQVYLGKNNTPTYVGSSLCIDEASNIYNNARNKYLSELADRYKDRLNIKVFNTLKQNE